jgi:uncharacterized protein
MTALAKTFLPSEAYEQSRYSLLPFQFLELDVGRYVVTNAAGQHIVLPRDVLAELIEKRLTPSSPYFRDLEAGHFFAVGNCDTHLELLAAQIRTRQSRLPELAGLHIFVVTLRCNHSCAYCQVSRVSEDKSAFDMSPETADRAVDIMLAGPSPFIKVEFQGGESLLNFPLIKRIVERVNRKAEGRDVAYVIATNLTVLTDEMLEYFAEHKIFISTSIDGPESLHNSNRPKEGGDSHKRVCDGIRRCRERLGHDSVSALMTCSSASLDQPEEIIDEYVRLGFTEVFLRHISPYGFAVRSTAKLGYNAERYLEFFRRGLAHILRLNRAGVAIRESYTSLILRRMLTSYPTGYVDLQSPTGAALGALVYNYDGDIYASDEGRMLAEMGDRTFRLGNVHTSTWDSLFLDSPMLDIAFTTMVEGVPGCSECAFQSWCGSDPVRHHTTQGDFIGHKPTSEFCYRNMETMRHIVRVIEDDPESARILRRWIK